MVNISQISSNIYQISITLIISLIITTTAVLNMVKKKRLSLFLPFFVFGLGLCLASAFMFYGFYGVSMDVFYVFSFVIIVGIFFKLWRQVK